VPDEVEAAKVYGAVADVPMQDGRDLLVAYRDNAVRYFNYAGSAAIVEAEATRARPALRDAVPAWLAVAQRLAAEIGVWDQPDFPPLPTGHARFMMLTPGGKRFGQAPQDALFNDARAGAFLRAAARAIDALATLQERPS